MAPLLEIEDLRTDIRLRTATVHALDGVSLTVEAGECLGIVGESGSGKTMTATQRPEDPTDKQKYRARHGDWPGSTLSNARQLGRPEQVDPGSIDGGIIVGN